MIRKRMWRKMQRNFHQAEAEAMADYIEWQCDDETSSREAAEIERDS